jgi:glucose/arabinose dehydrogenase
MRKIITAFFLLFTTAFIAQNITISEFASGFNSPLEIGCAGDQRLFVVEQGGSIRILNADGTINAQDFLTVPVTSLVVGGENGLLGLAFHPQYSSNGFFYISYTRFLDGALCIARYSVDPLDANRALPNSGEVLLVIPHLQDIIHNGGTLRFGPDGYFYIGVGDGGQPITNAQDTSTNRGKLLRIDVNQPLPYGIPADNPFANTDGNDEIWAIGLRNPWKYSFDSATGELWIGDVGQSNFEEINRNPASSAGLNYGWPRYEANSIYADWFELPAETCTFPIASYPHGTSTCSTTGGYVYHGTLYPTMQNKYFFSDFCANYVGMIDVATNNVTYTDPFPGDGYFFSSFGQDANGELYVAAIGTGKIYKILDAELARKEFSKSGFAIAPNPADSQFNVKLNLGNYPATATLIDITGKKLFEQTINSENQTIATDHLQSGIYLVSVKDASGTESTAKLAINKK